MYRDAEYVFHIHEKTFEKDNKIKNDRCFLSLAACRLVCICWMLDAC